MKDLLLNGYGDLVIEKGDLQVGLADEQAVGLLLMTEQGSVKFDPLAGVGLQGHLNSNYGYSEQANLKRKMSVQMEYEGFSPSILEINDLNRGSIAGYYEA
jgi:hypothetical protein